ncbi:MAG: flagellar biosynthesis anti-sigma factor FlgM [Proteobacteria bacterium]|nr:flagellar biosynthesis anti-sigma factor FlgM [Pseudomonadota bacterium]
MRIDDKITNYEINKQLANATPNIQEGQQLPDGQKDSKINTESQDAIVNLSQASKEVRLANKVISSTPDVREKKVLEIKEKIESGTYEINNNAVAAKLVDAFMDDVF